MSKGKIFGGLALLAAAGTGGYFLYSRMSVEGGKVGALTLGDYGDHNRGVSTEYWQHRVLQYRDMKRREKMALGRGW